MRGGSRGVGDGAVAREPKKAKKAPAESESLIDTSAVMRKVSGCKTASEALDMYLQEVEALGHTTPPLSDKDVRKIIGVALERGNFPLVVSLFDATCSSKASQGQWTWPRAGLETLQEILVGLAKEVQVTDAMRVLQVVRAGASSARNTEVPFGQVVKSPLPPCPPLAVVQPQEGCRVVACAESRYEFELFSGVVTRVSSEALTSQQSVLLAALRLAGVWRQPPTGAVHEVVVQTPGGQSRAFRFATETADVPAFEGQRVTVVCAPTGPGQRRVGILSTSPPGTKRGEPLSLCNHAAPGAPTTPLLRPPDASASVLPSWAPTVAILLAGSDAASGLIDPAMPLLIGAGVATASLTAFASTQYLLPELKRLPEPSVRIEEIRQSLLKQHMLVSERLQGVVRQAEEDIRDLARLSQLQQKMESVGDAQTYATRGQRVKSAAGGLEQRLRKCLELADGYARVLSMIEIEVEMDSEIPQAELADIGAEIDKLQEVEAMREEWQLQLEAQDEVERLLRSQGP